MSFTVASETYDVFVSYSRADGHHAREIDSVLRDKGLKTFFDRSSLAGGQPWVRALEQAIGAAKAAIVLIGPRGLGNTQQYERELAFVRKTRDPTFPVVPVILPETTTDPPFDFLRVLTWIDFSHVTRVSNAPDVLEQLLRAIHGQPTSAGTARDAICPYRGLDAFREEDAAFFFGRGSADDPESAIGQLVRKVREHPFVMVVGRSGSGKSSLVYAGLLPALRRERDRFWNVLSLRPGPAPLRALAAAFNPRAEDEGAAEYADKITNEADKLRTRDPELLSHMIREELDRVEGKPDRLLLYIDQWEELYAQAPSSGDKERAVQYAADVNRFINLLLTAARTAPVAVVATVRADFYDPLIAHQEIKSLLPTRQVLLGSMSRSELERTIVEPAKKVGLVFDPSGLVQRILDEAGEDEGMLPLLQYALKESWALRKGNKITGDSYALSGGVREAIRLTAERTFDALSPSDQHVARQLFLRLVTPGEGQEDTRARAAMPVDQAQRKIVEQFAAQRTRLLVTGYDRASRPTVEVAHEALIRTWPRLRQWIDANRQKLRSRAAILQAKAEWEQNGRRDDLLLPKGFQLDRARALLEDAGDLPIEDIQEFITLSSAHEEAEGARAVARLWQESGRKPSYLLFGAALKEAEKYVDAAPEVRELVAASRSRARRRIAVGAAIVVLLLIPWGSLTLWPVAIIDAISVPKDLEAAGYTPVTMAQRIKDAVTQIHSDAAVVKRFGFYTFFEVDPLEPESADYQSPGRGDSWDSAFFTRMSLNPWKKYDVSVRGPSLTTVIWYLREFFGMYDNIKVSGEITMEHPFAVSLGGKEDKSPPKKFSIRLRIDDKGRAQYEDEATDTLATLVEQAALKLVESFAPLDAAYYSYHKRDYDNALRIVHAYLAGQTKNERQWASNLLGLIEYARNRSDDALAEKGYNEAITVFEKLRASDPEFAPPLYNLSYILIDKGHKHLEDPEVARELFSGAYEVAREGLAIDRAAGMTAPERAAGGYATAGRALRFLGQFESANYDQALRYFDGSIDADPTFMYAYFSQGAIHNEREAHDKAIARYRLATEINPSAQTFTRAGAYLRNYGRHADSIPMFRKAAELKPTAYAYTYWGMAVRDARVPGDEARKLFEKAIATDPKIPNGHNQLGLMYLREEKWAEAAKAFEEAIKAEPDWSNYHYNLGRALRGAGNLKAARDAFKRAIQIYPSHPKAFAELDELELR
jgi:tetratricopeptide (TPR) repeat protein